MKRLILIVALTTSLLHAQAILVRSDSIKLPQASIWGGISFNGENISITTTFFQDRPHLFLRKLDTTLQQVGNLIQLTSNSDPVTAKHITDHKHLFLNGFHFITFSVAGDSDLYIFKVDGNGNRANGIVPVVERTSDRTNDMMLTTDGSVLYVAYFRPTSQSVVHALDQNLNHVGQPIVTSQQLPHNNLGSMMYMNGKFFMFTGSKAGPNSDLILTVWNHDWSPALSQPQLLIPTKPGEGLAFPTGIAYDSLRRRWYVGFHHMQNVNPDSTTHIDISVFDENFFLLEHQHRSLGFRPHFLLHNGMLYSVYDRGGVFLERYKIQDTTPAPSVSIPWKQYFTLAADEGIDFAVDSTAIVPGGGVPVLNVTNSGKIILTSSGAPQMKAFEVGGDGRTYTPTSISQRGPDGGFVYLPDGRTRFLGEEPDPGNTPQRHKSRIVSWVSNNGTQWIRESGVRYQPGAEDDSIASVPSLIQVKDSIWRMYFVADWYRTNGTRTAISYDWGTTWQQETKANILRVGDVDPHPVYLSDGRIRLYFRTGMGKPPELAGIGCCDSDDGLRFDTSEARLLIPDVTVPVMFKLDPAVIKLPSGQVVCYIGAAPFFGQTVPPKLIAAWGKKPFVSVEQKEGRMPDFELNQNYPNPFSAGGGSPPAFVGPVRRAGAFGGNPSTTISYQVSRSIPVTLKVYNMLGEEVATLVSQVQEPGYYQVRWRANVPSGIYVYRIQAGDFVRSRKLVVLK